MAKILIRLPNWIGDAVMALPAINFICRHYKNDQITLLSRPNVLELFKNDKRFYSSIDILNGKLETIFNIAKILKKMQFDTAILFQNALGAAIIAKLSRIPEIIGYKTDGRGILLTKAISVQREMRQDKQFINMIRAAGIDGNNDKHHSFLTIDHKEDSWAKNSLSGYSKPVVALFPGAAYGSAKRWPIENFITLAHLISNIGGTIILVGSPMEKEIGDSIEQSADVKNFIGNTTLRQTMALFSNIDLLVTNDSGPMHIASALGTPLIAIYGSTDPAKTPPIFDGKKIIVYKNVACSPCFLRICPIDFRCMKRITPEELFIDVKEMLNLNS